VNVIAEVGFIMEGIGITVRLWVANDRLDVKAYFQKPKVILPQVEPLKEI
jgi:hypothetical protein